VSIAEPAMKIPSGKMKDRNRLELTLFLSFSWKYLLAETLVSFLHKLVEKYIF